jgi:phosphatidylinositol-3-phosphatase
MKTLILALVASLLLTSAVMAAVPPAGHVYVVVEENHSYSSVIGNSAMPYLNSLASQYGLATKYYANTHPSIGNYFMLTTGQIITNNDSYMSTVTADNLVRHMLTAGKTWKSYAESLPYSGYTGGNTGAYVRRHNPFSYFSDVVNSSVQKMNLVPFTQFATDRANGHLPEFSFIVPNINDDAHNGTLAQADYWLKTNIGPLVASTAFQQSNDLLVIVFDESYDTDTAYGGGHVAMVVVGPKVRKGYKSTTLYQHQSTLRLISQALGLTTFPGKAAYAPTMGEFFGSSSTCTAFTVGVTICSPVSGTQPSTTVKFSAAAMGYHPISSMMIYVDNSARYTTYSASLSTSLTLSAGAHSVTIKSWDNTGQIYTKSVSISVP